MVVPYLLELRARLLQCILFLAVIFLLLSFYANQIYHVLALPLLAKLPQGAGLISTRVTATFSVPFKFSFIVSLALSAPYFLYHGWRFVSPALYSKEKRAIWFWLFLSVLLFYAGLLFAYYIALPLMFKFFILITPLGVELKPDISQYLDFTLQILFAFGCAFEVPIIIVAIICCDLVTFEQLKSARPYVIVLAFIVGMLLSPPDVMSQILLAVPLCLLYEVGMLLAKCLRARGV